VLGLSLPLPTTTLGVESVHDRLHVTFPEMIDDHTPPDRPVMTARINPLIAKLLPRLASNHDGEVVATARAIGRLLRADGLDLHDLATAIAPPSVPRLGSSRRHCRAPECRTMARECLRHTSLLRPREYEFLLDISRYQTLTPKQAQWLADIHQRVTGVAA